MLRYEVAEANQFLILTGANIQDVKLVKKALVCPGQSCTVLELSPVCYSVMVEGLSSDNMAFRVPVVFIIGPENEHHSLMKYAKLLSTDSEIVHDLVRTIVQGESRDVLSSMNIEDIVKGNTDLFKSKAYGRVDAVIHQFGLHIYDIIMNEVPEVPGLETSMQIVMVQKEAERKREEIKQEAELQIYAEEQKVHIAPSTLRVVESEREIESKRCLMQTEKLRTEFLSKSTVSNEMKVQYMTSEVTRLQKLADVQLYQKTKAVEAQRMVAEADRYTRQQAADAEEYEKMKQAEAELFAKQKKVEGELFAKTHEAEGLKASADPEGVYLKSILAALGGNYAAMRDYLLMIKGVGPGGKKLDFSGVGDISMVNVGHVAVDQANSTNVIAAAETVAAAAAETVAAAAAAETVVAAEPTKHDNVVAAEPAKGDNIVAGTLTIYQR